MSDDEAPEGAWVVLLTNAFPFGAWEPYLETELQYYGPMARVDVFALSVRPSQSAVRRPVPGANLTVHLVPFLSTATYLLWALTALWNRDFYRELRRELSARTLTLRRLVKLLVVVSRATYEARFVVRGLRKVGVSPATRFVLYSYRMEYHSYVALRVKRAFPECRVVLRGHRYDLYEEANPARYIPLRSEAFAEADALVAISAHGADYLRSRFPEYEDKVRLDRLGTTDHGRGPHHGRVARLRILSCSTITPVKRLDLLVAALREGQSPAVHWVHFGDGPLRAEIDTLVSRLPDRVSVQLKGEIDHGALMEHLAQTPYDVFVNVSDSEGLPVSIMEAMSFGIPVVATDVGGNGEIVSSGVNGALLPLPASPSDVARALAEIAYQDERAYSTLRDAARHTWKESFSADARYSAFVDYLNSLGVSREGMTDAGRETHRARG